MYLGHIDGCCRTGLYGTSIEIGEKCAENYWCQGDRYICHMTITDVDDKFISCTVDRYELLECDDSQLAWYATDEFDEEVIKNYTSPSTTKYHRAVKVGYDDMGRKLYAYPDHVVAEIREKLNKIRTESFAKRKTGHIVKYKKMIQ